MSNEIPVQKSFVKSDDEAMIVCPACDTAKKISARQFRHRQHLVKVKCKCGHLFKVHLEFRHHYRKSTELEGTYDVHPPAIGGGRMKVINLSLSGACVEVKGVHQLKIGQQGSLVFTLDDRKKTVLFKNVVIRSISGNRIGCQFVQNQAYDKDLGFYLLP